MRVFVHSDCGLILMNLGNQVNPGNQGNRQRCQPFIRASGRVRSYAGVAQLAEHNVANVVVVGSTPITRSYMNL